MTNNKILGIIAGSLIAIVAIYFIFISPISNNYSDITFSITIEDEKFKNYEVTKIEKSTIFDISKLQDTDSEYKLTTEVYKGYTLAGTPLYFGIYDIELINGNSNGLQYTIKHVKNEEISTYIISLRKNGVLLDDVQARL